MMRHHRTDSDLLVELANDLASIKQAVDFVMRECPSCKHDPQKIRLNFRISLIEALSNAMLYGNAEDPAKRVRLEVTFSHNSIEAKVTDEGGGFDPKVVPDPTQLPHLLEPTGRGIFLMRELLDEVFYNDRGNTVTMILHLDPSVGGSPQDGGARA